MWKTWANLLTLIRFGSIAPCAWAIASGHWTGAALLFSLAAITDLLDGPLARRYNQSSALGGLLDHATDALFVSVTLGALAVTGHVTAILPPLVMAAFIQYMLDSSALAGQHLRTSQLGRSNGIGYFVLVGIVVIRNAVGLDWPDDGTIRLLAWALVVTSVISMSDRARALIATRRT